MKQSPPDGAPPISGAELSNLLALCATLERTMARYYSTLARLFPSPPDITGLFEKTAREEDNHARQFELAKTLYKDLGVPVTGIPEIRAALDAARKAADDLAVTKPDLVTALRDAVKMENTFGDYHMNQVVALSTPSLVKLFTAMMDADRGHVQALEKKLAELT